MTAYQFSFGVTMAGIAMSTLVFAGEPSGIGEKGTGQTHKSTERQQSANKPDMSHVPQELEQGKSARAAEQLSHEKKHHDSESERQTFQRLESDQMAQGQDLVNEQREKRQ
jgi:hypothetical protein